MNLRLFARAALALLAAGLPALPVFAQQVPQGSEFKVNPSDGVFHVTPAMTVLPSGDFIVVWGGISDLLGNDTGDVIAQRVDRMGSRVGGEFLVNTWTTSSQGVPVIASNGSGAFVVVWESTYQDGDGHGVFGRLFDGSGAPVGGEFQVNDGWTGLQWQAAVDMDETGDFVVVWATTAEDGEIMARRFRGDGQPRGGEFQVNAHRPGLQEAPDMAMDAAGNFVVVWQSDDGRDGDGAGIFARRFDSGGAPVGAEFRVNDMILWSQERPRVDMTGTGEFVVAWDSPVEDLSYNTIFGRTFDRTGAPTGPEFRTGFAPSFGGTLADVAIRDDGEFLVTWVGRDGWGRGIFARSYDSLGSPYRDAFQVNEETSRDQVRPRIEASGKGRALIAWSSQLRPGVFARILDRPTLHVTAPRDGDHVDCSDPRLRRPTITWEPARFEEFRVELDAEPDFRGPMRDRAASGWIRGASWTPPRGLWRKACRAGLAGGVYNARLYLRVVGRDLDLTEKDPDFLEAAPVMELPIGVDLLNPPRDPVVPEEGERGRPSRFRPGSGG